MARLHQVTSLPAWLLLGFALCLAEGRRSDPGGASQDSDSILELINMQEVERLLAERRQNESREGRLYLSQNVLDDDVGVKSGRNPHTVGVDVLIRKHNVSTTSSFRSSDVLADLSGFRGDKLLKSSKNALLVTRKEYLKRDWCKTEPLVQRIREDGCISRTVINRFCYGQCNSFYIPKNPRKKRFSRGKDLNDDDDYDDDEEDAPAFKSCAFCKPKKVSWVTVTLHCPLLSPQLRKKRIQRIKQCKCITEVVN